jgi:hypothetical protein
MGLGFDEWDLEFYTKMFTEQLKRNPSDVECFDLGTCLCVREWGEGIGVRACVL